MVRHIFYASRLIWGAVSFMSAGIILATQKISIERPIDNSQILFIVIMAVFGIVITLLFYLLNLIRRL